MGKRYDRRAPASSCPGCPCASSLNKSSALIATDQAPLAALPRHHRRTSLALTCGK